MFDTGNTGRVSGFVKSELEGLSMRSIKNINASSESKYSARKLSFYSFRLLCSEKHTGDLILLNTEPLKSH